MEKYHNELKKNEKFKLKNNISTMIRKKLKARKLYKNGRKTWGNILDYSVEDLKQHLESQFEEGMTWDNYGEWHVDHKTPDSWFDYSSIDDEDFKKSWALENLQPMWGKENISKGNRYAN